MFNKLLSKFFGTVPTPPSIYALRRTKEQKLDIDAYPRNVVHLIGGDRYIVIDTHHIMRWAFRARTGDGCLNYVASDPEDVHNTLYIFRGPKGLKKAEEDCKMFNDLNQDFTKRDQNRELGMNEVLAIK